MKKSNHYVDNEKLLEVLTDWKRRYDSTPEGEDKPRIPEYVGECIMKISEGLAKNGKVRNYPFKEDMIFDAIETCVKYLHNFDPDKFSNPFGYISRIAWFAFLTRIKKEKKELAVKQVFLQNLYFEGLLADQNINDTAHPVTVDLDNPYMTELVDSINKKSEKDKEVKRKKSSKKGVDKLFNEE